MFRNSGRIPNTDGIAGNSSKSERRNVSFLRSYMPHFTCKFRQLYNEPVIAKPYSLFKEQFFTHIQKIFAIFGSYPTKFRKSRQVNCVRKSAVIVIKTTVNHNRSSKIFTDFLTEQGHGGWAGGSDYKPVSPFYYFPMSTSCRSNPF